MIRKYLLTFLFVVLSFYFTDSVMNYINNKNPIMIELLDKKDDYKIDYVNAIVKDNTIIPGLKGREVDVEKSFYKMNDFGSFNDYYLVYNNSTPLQSLNNNLDKVIIRGNSKKNMVSFIVNNNQNVIDYFDNNNINYTLLGKLSDAISNKTMYINGENDKDNFSDLNSILNKKKVNSKICLIDYSNLESCLEKEYYLVSYSMKIGNIVNCINSVRSGEIILIENNDSLNDVLLLLSEIKRNDLKIDYLNNLISEAY